MYLHQGCANTGTISIQRAGAKVRIHISKIIPQKYFPVFALMRIQAPHVFAQKSIPQEFSPACIGFVPESCCILISIMIVALPHCNCRRGGCFVALVSFCSCFVVLSSVPGFWTWQMPSCTVYLVVSIATPPDPRGEKICFVFFCTSWAVSNF